MKVLGLDGCKTLAREKGGRDNSHWIGVSLEVFSGDWSMVRLGTSELERAGDYEVIAIDIPLGQLSGCGRECDPAARRLIGRRRSSVFAVPFREALMGATRSEADARSRALGGPGVPAQTFGLFPKIVELRSLMLRAPSIAAKLFEIHPEVSFWAINGGSDLDFPKRHEFGKLQRRQLLTAEFGADLDERITALGVISSAVAWDDVYDAFAAAWTAKRIALGKAERVTPLLQVDESLDHIVNIWY